MQPKWDIDSTSQEYVHVTYIGNVDSTVHVRTMPDGIPIFLFSLKRACWALSLRFLGPDLISPKVWMGRIDEVPLFPITYYVDTVVHSWPAGCSGANLR